MLPVHPCVPRRVRLVVQAVQASPVSGDSDGEIEISTPQKSYSIAVTIVSGCDASLRRNVIEKIAAQSSAGRVVVVTQGGITSTDEQDGPVVDSTQETSNGQGAKPNANVNGFPAPVGAIRPADNLEGWISCSSPDEMAEVVAKLAAGRDCDYIIAEGSTDSSMEPQELAQLLHARGGASLRVDSLVSVLDGDTLLTDLSAFPSPPETDEPEGSEDITVPPPAMQDAADTRPMMVVSLVENANVIVVARSGDIAPSESLTKVQSLLSVLNGSANILPATRNVVPVDQLLNTNLYDHESVMLGATWKKVLIASRRAAKGATKPALPKSLKEAAFVYRARRPFHPQRLYSHIKAVATFNGVIRSTGQIWLATRMLAPLEWNQAGVAATLSLGKLFWAAIPETEWPTDEKERERIMDNWDNQYGDRETEIVFVGMGIDKERLQGLLDGCLLQDEEMVFTNMWENFEDPFVEWVPLIEDEDEDFVPEEDASAVVEVQAPAKTTNVDEPVAAAPEEALATQVPDDGRQNRVAEAAVEGALGASDIPGEMYEKVSALDIFEQGFSDDSESAPQPQPADDGSYDEDDVVVASWDGSVADGILRQMPKCGLPVTIVTGFLGSGKTTLLNYVLTADHGLKIAVLVNEFGEIDIDNQLVEKGDWSSKDEVMELANGCICCSINDSFINAVSKILERGDRIDYLIVETTGVADPVPIINSLMVSDIAEQVRVDGILTLVDAENFEPKTNMNSEAALSQILTADTIMLSKTDVASTKKVDETIQYIKSVRPAARILKSQRGRVPINMILDVGLRVADSPAHLNPVKKSEEKGIEHSHDAHAHGHDHDHDHDDECGPDCTDESHNHDHGDHLAADGFVTTSFKSDAPLDPQLFMDKFLQRLPEGVFRAKGLLQFYGYGGRYIFQLSGRRYQFEEDEWPEGVASGNQLVIIGKDLDLESLRETLAVCLVEESV